MIVAVTLVGLLLIVPAIQGYEQGVFNHAYGCNCHSQTGSNAASVSISGLPSSYDAGNMYQLTVDVSGGVPGSSGGFSLEVNKGTLSTGIGAMLVNVNNQGNSATHSITGSSYRSWSFEWTAPAAGAGQVTFEVAGMTTNGNGGNSGDRWTTSVVQLPENVPVNGPPSVSNVILAPTDPVTSNQLSLSYSYSDPDNDQESGSEITWYRDSQALPQGTINGLSVPASETQKGQEWYATIRPSDGTDYGNTVTSNTVTIANSAPSLVAPIITPASPEQGDDLTVSYSAADDDQDVLTISINWYLDGALVTEFNDDITVPSIATRHGDEWRVEVTVSDGTLTETRSSQVITIGDSTQINSPPELSSLEISPTYPVTSDNLQVIYTAEDLDNDQIIDVEIEWLVGSSLTSQVSSSIPAVETQKGQLWTVKVRVNDGKDWSIWYESSVLIRNSPPVVDSITISPAEITTDDEILVEYTYTDLDGDELDDPVITWSKNGASQPPLDGVNPLPAQYTSKGDNWSVSVKASDGESVSQVSVQASVTVVNSLPILTITEIPSNLSFADNGLPGLTVDPIFTDADGDEIETSIQWLRNGFREGSLDNLTTVPAALFGAGQTWTLLISYHDNDGPLQQYTHTVNVDNLAPVAVVEILSADLWDGEIIRLDGSKSFDLDGTVANYFWQYQDSLGNSGIVVGEQIEIIGQGTIGIILTVEDDLGLVDTVTQIIQTTTGPSASGLIVSNSPAGVSLSWGWSGDDTVEFILYRNGERVGNTTELEFTDKPIVAGLTSYTIAPVVGGQELVAGAVTIVDFDVAINTEIRSDVSESGGFVLGIMILISSIAMISIGILQRRGEIE